MTDTKSIDGAKVLFLDIETAPMLLQGWDIWDQSFGLNQIKKDWSIISWSAKWRGTDEVMYEDQRNCKDVRDDKKLLKNLWKLINEADVLIHQNGTKFDRRKINARLIFNEYTPPSSYKQIDTFLLGKRHFGFTSYKLEYMAEFLGVKYKKLKHKKFPGFELWDECLNGNIEAWREMEKYNKHDVLALEAVFDRMISWDDSINFNLYHDDTENTCKCGSTKFTKNGFAYTNSGKFQRYKCSKSTCGSETRSRKNLFSKEKKESLRINTTK